MKQKEQFILKARQVHGWKYDYSKVEYVDNYTKVCIICPEHGEFWQTPYNHLKGCGCKKCKCKITNVKKILTTNQFIEKAKQIHGNKYDYSKAQYVLSAVKTCIICPMHGDFLITPNNHLRGKGCPKCVGKNKTTEEFIKQCREIHGDKYDYSKVNYVNAKTKICIICPEHGEFWQTPNKHLAGEGCPQCKSSVLETKIRRMLIENNIPFEREYSNSFLGRQRIDFFIPNKKIGIECQGRQHYLDNGYYFNNKQNNQEEFDLIQKRDFLKHKKCSENDVTLLYFFPQNMTIQKIISKHNNNGIYTYENSFNKISDILKKIQNLNDI